jgi:hypothetical protein
MTLRSIPCSMIFLLMTVPLLAAPAGPADSFTVSSPAKIPGATLQPGSYSIHLVNRLSDRMILKVDSANGEVHSTFIGIANGGIAKPASAGPVRWANPADGVSYLKGWYFPGSSSVVEFVYPKTDAVAIATSNPAKVPAVDPASEGKPADNTLSKDDMQLLTLWLLSLEQVGPGTASPGIKAERYQQVASVSHKPVVSALPHTASFMPLVWIAGLCSLIAAGMLRFFRLQRLSAAPMAKLSQ